MNRSLSIAFVGAAYAFIVGILIAPFYQFLSDEPDGDLAAAAAISDCSGRYGAPFDEEFVAHVDNVDGHVRVELHDGAWRLASHDRKRLFLLRANCNILRRAGNVTVVVVERRSRRHVISFHAVNLPHLLTSSKL